MRVILVFFTALAAANGYEELVSNVIRSVTKRQDSESLLDISPQCSNTLSRVSPRCLTNLMYLIETYKEVEKKAAESWGSQCADNLYNCVSSPDQETKKVIKFFQQLLPKIKTLCADGCMIPIINLIHDCVRADVIEEIGISKQETEEIFDLICIQKDNSQDGSEGEYCMISAMETALYLYEANQIHYCDLDGINLDTCTNCVCPTNCSSLLTQASSLMGCCLGTLLDLEKRFNLTHHNDDTLLNPANKLFKLCGVNIKDKCKTSKDIIDSQEKVYSSCYESLVKNAESNCIQMENDAHTLYLKDMQNIGDTCQKQKNLGVCAANHSLVPISNDLRSIMSKLNQHCDECQLELAGIRDNCTVFLPNEARMVFQLMCVRSSDGQQCGPRVIEYEAEMGRGDLNQNPCFKNTMPKIQSFCTPECIVEVHKMNSYGVLSCLDALVVYSISPPPEFLVWHRNCIVKSGIDIKNKMNFTMVEIIKQRVNVPTEKSNSNVLKTVGYTFVGTVLLSLLLAGVVFALYKRQRIWEMFGYNKFRDDNLMSELEVQADDDSEGYTDSPYGNNF